MIIRKYNEFIMESFYGDIFQRLAQFNIPDLNYLLNQLISKDRESDRKELCEEIIDVLKINRKSTPELEDEVEKLTYVK